jgi:hypothetical protein
MKHYIIHNDELVDRRKSLQDQLDKHSITDVEWVTTFPKSHPIISQIKEDIDTVMPLGYISCSMKHYDALNRMINENIQEAIIFEDDVILSEFYDEEKLPKYPYIKLGRGPTDCMIPLGTPLCKVQNPGGSEAYYVTSDFAREYLKTVSFAINVDLEQYFFMLRIGIVPLGLSMCHQEFKMSFDTTTIDYKPWAVDYYHGKLHTFDISKLLNSL